MGQKITASVIIGTYNRSNLLKRALESLLHQTVKPDIFEIIVIDDGSNDGTKELLKEITQSQSHIHSITNEKNLGLSSARNQGVAAASGEHLLFMDDDCMARNDWVAKLCDCLDGQPVVAGAIDSPKSNFIKLSHNIAHFHPFMPGQKPGPIDFLAGANMGFQRQVLEELQGFDEGRKLAGDTHLCLKARTAGYIPYLAQEAVVVHDPKYISLRRAITSSYQHAGTTVLLRNEFSSLLQTPFFMRSPLLLRIGSPLIALVVTARIYFRNPRLLRYYWTAPLVLMLKLVWCWGAAAGLRKNKGARPVNFRNSS